MALASLLAHASRSPWRLLDTCHEAVEDVGISDLGERKFYLLCRARDIARYEPFNDGNRAMGSREGRV